MYELEANMEKVKHQNLMSQGKQNLGNQSVPKEQMFIQSLVLHITLQKVIYVNNRFHIICKN